MARKIRLDQVGDYATGQFEKLLRAAVLETDSMLKLASPVDTGRFRASWQVGENAAGFYDAGPQQDSVNKSRSLTSPPSKPQIALRKMNYKQERAGNVYSVHNNLPYAIALAGGSYPPSWGGQYRSRQASPGWVQLVAKDIQGRVLIAANRIGKQS